MLPICTPRLILREYIPEDLSAVHAYASRAEVMQFQGWGPNTKTDTEAFLEMCMQAQQREVRRIYELAIVLQDAEALIGGCGLFLDKINEEQAQLGYILHPDYWGQGLATEASKGLVQLARHLKVRQLRATCDVRNHASRRVLEKIQMELIDTIPNHFKQKGHWRTSLLFERMI